MTVVGDHGSLGCCGDLRARCRSGDLLVLLRDVEEDERQDDHHARGGPQHVSVVFAGEEVGGPQPLTADTRGGGPSARIFTSQREFSLFQSAARSGARSTPSLNEMADETTAVVPHGDRRLRACMVTGLVKTEEQAGAPSRTRHHTYTPALTTACARLQWVRDGNENVPFLLSPNEREIVFEVTSPNFDGLVAMMKPDESWVARWQGITTFVPGCYALRVRGTLPEQHRQTLEENGARYHNLDDTSAMRPE